MFKITTTVKMAKRRRIAVLTMIIRKLELFHFNGVRTIKQTLHLLHSLKQKREQESEIKRYINERKKEMKNESN